MGYSNWDKGSVEDGLISGRWYVVDVDYAACYDIYNSEPVGDKEVDAEAAIIGKRYVITSGGRVIAALPTDWTQLPHAVKTRGPLKGTAMVKWRAYDTPQRFMVNLYLKRA